MTGLKKVEEGVECINNWIIPMINKLSREGKVIDKFYTIGENNIQLTKYDIVLINSDYSINFEIRRDILHYILNSEYGILASFEADIYPGVNAKYWGMKIITTVICAVFANVEKIYGQRNGKGDGQCKKVTISTFRGGEVLLLQVLEQNNKSKMVIILLIMYFKHIVSDLKKGKY